MGVFRDQDGALREQQARLETPREAGFRPGISSTGMIGSRLARVFDVTREVPREMGVLIRSMDESGRR